MAAKAEVAKKDPELVWEESFLQVIKDGPNAFFVREEDSGKPTILPRKVSKATSWVIEFSIKHPGETAETWHFSTYLNVETLKSGIWSFSHSAKWCLARFNKHAAMFNNSTFIKNQTRMRNLVTGDILMAAVLTGDNL